MNFINFKLYKKKKKTVYNFIALLFILLHIIIIYKLIFNNKILYINFYICI